jgi:hypothetical protein
MREGRPPSRHPTIIDIGTGNGVLLCKLVNALAQVHELQAVNLILLDSSQAMLLAAKERCAAELCIQHQLTLVCKRVQELTPGEMRGLRALHPWFVFAAATLHHLPRNAKLRTFTDWTSVSPNFFLAELEADHDLAATNSERLFRSVSSFYGHLIEQVRQSQFSPSDSAACIDNFLFSEAIHILCSNYPLRGDYHTLMHDWGNLAIESGFQVHAHLRNQIVTSGPASFLLWLKSDLF